jgi:ABC-type transporter Mla maintaining outer membrane lipid asymmetry ATPase subunit MlaF
MSDSPPLRAQQLSTRSVRDLSFAVAPGSVCKLLVSSRDRRNELVALLTGLAPPASGRLWILGEDLYGLDEAHRIALFQRVGVVVEDGGLITNLKAWENILLPSMYHHGKTAADVEPQVIALFQELYPGEQDLQRLMGKLPDHLTLYEKRLVALVRAFLLDPELMLYDFLVAGVDRDSAARLLAATERFHAARPGRVSVYLCGDDAASARIKADQTIELEH